MEMCDCPLSFSLLILTVMNVGLFFKLWAMEDLAQRMYMTSKHRFRAQARSDSRLLNPKLLQAFALLLPAAAMDSVCDTWH